MNVDKIAIIGSGPSGLVALNEFLHTAKDGSSLINSFRTSENKIPVDPAFREIVVFTAALVERGTTRKVPTLLFLLIWRATLHLKILDRVWILLLRRNCCIPLWKSHFFAPLPLE